MSSGSSRSNLSRSRKWGLALVAVLAAALLAGAATWWWSKNMEPYWQAVRKTQVFEKESNTRVAMALLKTRGYEVQTQQGLSTSARELPAKGTLLTLRSINNTAQSEQLLTWVRQGNTLITLL